MKVDLDFNTQTVDVSGMGEEDGSRFIGHVSATATFTFEAVAPNVQEAYDKLVEEVLDVASLHWMAGRLDAIAVPWGVVMKSR